jgi:hypothetical protein
VKADSMEMMSVVVHEEFHMEDATMKSSGIMKKWHRD